MTADHRRAPQGRVGIPPSGTAILWVIGLDRPDAEYRRLSSMLSPDERSRSDRFLVERSRRHYRTCRGAVRVLLSGYMGCAPESLKFEYGLHGKPALADAAARAAGLHFNLAHSDGTAVLAIARDREIGVDIESIDRLADFTALAERFFSKHETREVLSLPPALRGDAFIRCWTLKEAYIKATGEGLTCPLDAFSVSLGKDARMNSIRGDRAEAAKWCLRSIKLRGGLVAAVATRSPIYRVELRRWRGISTNRRSFQRPASREEQPCSPADHRPMMAWTDRLYGSDSQ